MLKKGNALQHNKPIRGTPLNPIHPLSQGLIFAWAGLEQCGLNMWDSARKNFDYQRYFDSGTPAYWSNGALWLPGGAYFRWQGDAEHNLIWNAIRRLTFSSAYGFNRVWDDMGGSPYTDVVLSLNNRQTGQALYQHLFYRDLANNYLVGRITSKGEGWNNAYNGDATLEIGKDHITIDVVDYVNNIHRSYIDGWAGTSSDGARPSQLIYPDYSWVVFYLTYPLNALIGDIPYYFIYYWDRPLTVGEVKMLNDDPYCMYRWPEAPPSAIADWTYAEYIELTSAVNQQLGLSSELD